MQAVRRQTDQNVADLNVLSGDDLVAADCTDDCARKIVLAVGVEARHLRRLTADQSAAVGSACLADALHDPLDDHIFEFAAGQVVEEEERRRTLHCDVVDAVIDQVLPNGVVDAEVERDLELCAHAVGARDQYRVGKLFEIQSKQAAEAADLAEYLFVEGLPRQHLDALFAAITRGNVDPGVRIADRSSSRVLLARSPLDGRIASELWPFSPHLRTAAERRRWIGPVRTRWVRGN